MKASNSLEISILAITAAPFLYLAWVWNSLPEIVPTHWNLDGVADRTGSKMSLLILPCVLVGLYFLLRFLPALDPKKKLHEMGDSFGRLRLILTLGLAAMACFIIFSTQHASEPTGIFVIVGAMLAGIGNYLTTVKPNYFIGIRTPWTLEHPEVWRKTHLLGGRLLFWSSLAAVAAFLVLPRNWGFAVFLLLILGSTLGSVVYSYLLFKKEKTV